MTPDDAERQARIRFLLAGTGFFRAGQVAAWAAAVYMFVAVIQRVVV